MIARKGNIERMNEARWIKPAAGGKLYQRTVLKAAVRLAPDSRSEWEHLFATMIQREHESAESFLRVTGLLGASRYMSADDIRFAEEGF